MRRRACPVRRGMQPPTSQGWHRRPRMRHTGQSGGFVFLERRPGSIACEHGIRSVRDQGGRIGGFRSRDGRGMAGFPRINAVQSAGLQIHDATPQAMGAEATYGSGGYDPNTLVPNAQGIANVINKYMSKGGTTAGAIEQLLGGGNFGFPGGLGVGATSPDVLQTVQRLTAIAARGSEGWRHRARTVPAALRSHRPSRATS